MGKRSEVRSVSFSIHKTKRWSREKEREKKNWVCGKQQAHKKDKKKKVEYELKSTCPSLYFLTCNPDLVRYSLSPRMIYYSLKKRQPLQERVMGACVG
jgi:hypothetical protein